MELYLDSADLSEIRSAFRLGFLTGLTTTPTFMHREGVHDVDQLLVELAGTVPVLQIEALGNTAEEIVREAQRQLDLGLDPAKTVFKIPISLEGVRACNLLRQQGLLVNVHLVYTLQQAYMAMQAGATYVCPLVGRLQDQGHDALAFVEQCVQVVHRYGYSTKVMFSSVRNSEHVRNALNIGVHAITVPWKILPQLTENNFTKLGIEQFVHHHRLITTRIKDIINGVNPVVGAGDRLSDSIVKMSEYGFGCVTVLKPDGGVLGVFTDGDLRRLLQQNGQDVLGKTMQELPYNPPVTIESGALLNEAANLFQRTNVDTILVTEGGQAVGMLDIQDLEAAY